MIVVDGRIEEMPVVLAVMEYRFMGGSMGSVVGEKITRAAEHALAASGARWWWSRRRAARACRRASCRSCRWRRSPPRWRACARPRLPYISVLTDPTTGGVTASFAMLGDLNIAEPGALIGFAGPRVIEQTIRQSLPEGFQTSEFLLEKGFLDLVVKRTELKETLARCLRHLTGRAAARSCLSAPRAMDASAAAILDRLEQFGIRLGLDTTRGILAALGESASAPFRWCWSPAPTARARPPRSCKPMRAAAGYRTGFYSSPHLETPERADADRRRRDRRASGSASSWRGSSRPARRRTARRRPTSRR